MKTMWRSWRVLLLAWAVLLAPQLSFVHALSHITAAATSAKSADERQQAPDKVCDTCLAFAQVGAALPSHHEWQPHAGVLAHPVAALPHGVSPRHTGHFLARAPPPALI